MSSEILGNEEDSIFISDKADVSLSGSAGVKRWKHGRPFQRETGKPNATDEFALSIAERAKRTRSQAANPTTPVGHQPTSRPRLTAKAVSFSFCSLLTRAVDRSWTGEDPELCLEEDLERIFFGHMFRTCHSGTRVVA